MMIGKRTYCILGTMLLAFASLGAGVSAEQNNEQATNLEDLGILELSIDDNGVIEAMVTKINNLVKCILLICLKISL